MHVPNTTHTNNTDCDILTCDICTFSHVDTPFHKHFLTEQSLVKLSRFGGISAFICNMLISLFAYRITDIPDFVNTILKIIFTNKTLSLKVLTFTIHSEIIANEFRMILVQLLTLKSLLADSI